MRLLLDTHALIWWLQDDRRLGAKARAAIIDPGNDIFASSINAFEITTKYRIGKMPEAAAMVADLDARVSGEGFSMLALAFRHARHAGLMDDAHKDPFDRMLIAQALLEGFVLVSNETLFDRFGVQRLW